MFHLDKAPLYQPASLDSPRPALLWVSTTQAGASQVGLSSAMFNAIRFVAFPFRKALLSARFAFLVVIFSMMLDSGNLGESGT